MGGVEGEAIPGILAVAAITDDFSLKVLFEKGDREKVGERLRAKQTDEYLNLAGRADTGIRLIEREVLLLQSPDEATLRRVYQRLREIHSNAYDWEAPEIPWPAAAVTRRMRSYVRRWVNEWDLKRLYPGASLSADEEIEMRPAYEQDEDLEPEAGE